jgi:serine/threonine-protein kinase
MSGSSFLPRLKERKLVRWAFAYLAGAFVVFQAVEVLAEPWGVSPGVQRGVHILLVFGLLITLVLAWYHGERGRQRVSGPELLMLTAILVVTGVALSMLAGGGGDDTAAVSPAHDGHPAIAVLPFENLSPNPENAYFADGMREQLAATLAKIRGLSVRGRMSVMRYRDDPRSLPEIAQELGVAFVIEGSVRIAGGQVSFTAQLMDAARDESLWADEFDQEFSVDEIVSVHREIAEQVVSRVRTILTPEDEARIASPPTANTEAFQEYLKGRFHWSTRTARGLETARGHFQRALELDSTFALAWAGLADCFTVTTYYSGEVDPGEMYRLGESAAEEALRLDPDLAAAHASLGFLKMISRRDWVGAEASLRRAIALDSAYSYAHHWLADLLSYSQRFEEALEEGRRAIELDPLAFPTNYAQAARLLVSRRFEAAAAQYERTIDLYPHLFLGWAGMAETLLAMGDVEGAIRNRSRSDELFGIDPVLSETHLDMMSDFHRTGIPGSLPPALDTLSSFPPGWRATAAMYVGDTAKALAWLEEAAAGNWPDVLSLRNSPLFDPLRDHPRFQALIEEYFGDAETSGSREP